MRFLCYCLMSIMLVAVFTPATAAADPVTEGLVEPFLDRTVGSATDRFQQWLARMKQDHFTAYLMVVTTLTGAVLGTGISLITSRFGDPMAPYRRVRSRTSLLAVACGGGIGVLFAVTLVNPAASGKVTFLALAVLCGAVTTGIFCLAAFIILRQYGEWRARRRGTIITGRLRLP